MKTLLVYASRYGSTKLIGEWIIERLGFVAEIKDVKEAPDPSAYELIIIGSGVYNEKVLPEINIYIDKYLDVLEEKQVVLYAVCMDVEGVYLKGKIWGGWEYLLPLIKKFKNPPLHAGLLHGEINPAKLSQEDYQKLLWFYQKVLRQQIDKVPYKTMLNKQEAWAFAEKILWRLKNNNDF